MKEKIAIALLMIGVFAGTIGVTIYKDAHAAAPPVEACAPWHSAGGVVIYRCQDDYSDDRCYVSSAGMMFCLGN